MRKTVIQTIVYLFLGISMIHCNKTLDENSGCLPVNLQNGIIAFYPFNSGSLNDLSGNNYHLSNPTTAAPGADRAGNTNCAFSFSRTNKDFLTYANPTFINDFQSVPFSISVWYKPVGIVWGFEVLVGRDVGFHCPDTHGQWSVALFDVRRAVFGINEYSLWDEHYRGLNTIEYLSNVWQHLVVTCKGNDLQLYHNGVLTSESAGTGCYPLTNKPTLNAGDLFLGKDFDGLLDDVIIYNRILSPSEVNALYQLAPCCQ